MAFERSERRSSGREGRRSSSRGSEREGRRNSSRSSGREGGRNSGFGGRDSRRSRQSRGDGEIHSAVCDKCGANCELPFKPTRDKPVLCSDCFRKDSNSGSRNSSSKVDLSEINAKLDKILKLLE